MQRGKILVSSHDQQRMKLKTRHHKSWPHFQDLQLSMKDSKIAIKTIWRKKMYTKYKISNVLHWANRAHVNRSSALLKKLNKMNEIIIQTEFWSLSWRIRFDFMKNVIQFLLKNSNMMVDNILDAIINVKSNYPLIWMNMEQ